MTAGIDLLPAAYRRRLATRRAHRELAALALLVLSAIVATDHLLRQRLQALRQAVTQARDHVARSQHLAGETRALTRQAGVLHAQIDAATGQLAAPRMTAVLDGLLAGRPAGVRLLDLRCVHDPWGADPTPAIQLHATCSTATDFTQYLTALGLADALPPLVCERSDIRPGSVGFGFQLQTDKAAARNADGGRR